MIPEGWRTYKFEAIAELRKEQVPPKGERQPYIGLEHIEQQSLRLKGIGDSQDVISNKYKFYNGDILYGKLRPYFKKVYQPKFEGVCSTDIYVIKNKETIDRTLLFYLVASGEFTNIANSGSSGTRMPRAEWNQLLKSEWAIPESLDEQSRIASILSSLDDKIELNLKMNKTLEAIAQAIFKEWFIDFRFPGFDGELVDGLPNGWKKGKLGDIIDLKYGKALKSENRIPGKYPVVGSSGIVGFHNEPLVKSPGIVVGRKGTIGEVIWLDEDFYPIDTTFFIEDQLGVNGLYFHYYLLLSQDFKKTGSDSAVPGLNRNQGLTNPIICPDINLIKQFNTLIEPIFKKKYLNNQEVKTLILIRDTLLPKLMTGKIRVA